MASRRSRLQIKPNIGGVKPVASKSISSHTSSQSVPTKDLAEASETENVTEKQNHENLPVAVDTSVTGQGQVESPSATIDTEKQIDQPSNNSKDDKVVMKVVESEFKKAYKIEENTNGEHPVSDKKSEPGPQRARLRRFEKVNIAVARDNVCEKGSQEKDVDELHNDSLEKESSLYVKEEVFTSKISQHKDEHVESPKTEEKMAASTSAGNTARIARRSKFPKAKPNLGLKRQRDADIEKKNTVEVSPKVEKKSVKLPEIIVTAEPNENRPSESTGGDEQKHSRPLAVPKSPLKAPTPNIFIASPLKDSAEKCATTTGSTEPRRKKVRRVMVDAPVDQPPDRTSMRMKDLIHWNPSSNPMKHKNKVAAEGVEKENIVDVVQGAESEEEEELMEDTPLPVPQVTVGPDGNIIINEKSLVVKEDLNKGVARNSNVIDETDTTTTYMSFMKRPPTRSKPWSQRETMKFYKALAMIGIDFFLITQLFPNRTREDIKKKFHKEERTNHLLVDKVLRERIKFDPGVFDKKLEPDSEDEEEALKKKSKGPRQRKPNRLKETSNKRKSNRKKGLLKRGDYFMETSEEEEDNGDDLPHDPAGKDPTWVPGVAGEVVDILVDMSKDRLSTDHAETASQEDGMRLPLNVVNSPQYIATPIPSFNTKSTSNIYKQNQAGNQGNAIFSQENDVKYSDAVSGNSFNANVGYMQASQLTENESFLSNVDSNMGMANATIGIPQTIDGDQYVLVTVVPEGGGETVIHIYRVHGGLLEGGPGGSDIQISAQQLADGETSLTDLPYELTATLPILPVGDKVEIESTASGSKEFTTLQSASQISTSGSETQQMCNSADDKYVVTTEDTWKSETATCSLTVASSCEMSSGQQVSVENE
ncbi:uncharacterized protein LOC127843667 isoform X2 [Dreissena polymorpha]|uniref:uncharacterized protein LOC127843667 isoform X2 n=1 Tax=Dreissena polymorpha TaxID=45954 RepID=UPI0022653139|nr:uncharacterized protein LOC127843667 isoform X2 [Dreissena polymorpha]